MADGNIISSAGVQSQIKALNKPKFGAADAARCRSQDQQSHRSSSSGFVLSRPFTNTSFYFWLLDTSAEICLGWKRFSGTSEKKTQWLHIGCSSPPEGITSCVPLGSCCIRSGTALKWLRSGKRTCESWAQCSAPKLCFHVRMIPLFRDALCSLVSLLALKGHIPWLSNGGPTFFWKW